MQRFSSSSEVQAIADGEVFLENPLRTTKYNPDWKVTWSETHQKKYYYNKKTKVTSWTVPPDMDPVLARTLAITPKASKRKTFAYEPDPEAGGLDDESSDEGGLDARAARALMPPRALRYLQLLLYVTSVITTLGALTVISFCVWSIVDALNGPFSLLPNPVLYGIVVFAVFILFSSIAGFCGTKMKQRKIMYMYLITTLITLLCQSGVAVLMLLKYGEYEDAAMHTYADNPNAEYDSFTKSIIGDWVKNENEKWTRYQNSFSPACCGYDIETYIDGKALQYNMMTGVACSKGAYSSFGEIGAPIGGDDEAFRNTKRTVENMLFTTMAVSDYSKLGTNTQKVCIPEKSQDRTKQWNCPVGTGADNVTASCSMSCLNAIRARYATNSSCQGAECELPDEITHETLMVVENKLMCKRHIFKTARDFSLVVALSALGLCVVQIASVGTSCYLVFSYYADGDVVVEDDDFDSDDNDLDGEGDYEMSSASTKKARSSEIAPENPRGSALRKKIRMG